MIFNQWWFRLRFCVEECPHHPTILILTDTGNGVHPFLFLQQNKSFDLIRGLCILKLMFLVAVLLFLYFCHLLSLTVHVVFPTYFPEI